MDYLYLRKKNLANGQDQPVHLWSEESLLLGCLAKLVAFLTHSELQIKEGIQDNSKMNFLVSQQKYML